MEKRNRIRVADLPSHIPSVPIFDGESSLNVADEAAAFLSKFSTSVSSADWQAFADLFLGDNDGSFWRDSLTLTFDKRTLKGRRAIVEAWEKLSVTRKPSSFSGAGDAHDANPLLMGLVPQFVRLSPTLASLDVPFSFETDAPKSRCVGLAKLVPAATAGGGGTGEWKIWVLTTAVFSLQEHPFLTLPRKSASSSLPTSPIDPAQRGKPQAQGLPRLLQQTSQQQDGSAAVLDAVVIGVSVSGLANTIQLDSIGANVAAFDTEPVAGGNWVSKRYDDITLHHPALMIGLPQFPVLRGKDDDEDESYPEYLKGPDIARYFASAVETLQLPVFLGIHVISNTFDEIQQIWHVRIRDVAFSAGAEAVIQARNIVLCTGYFASPEYPKFPPMKNRHLFRGPVQHTSEYRTAAPYHKHASVVVVGSGNSAHDVARNLVLKADAGSVTLLQRSPAMLVDFEPLAALMNARYMGSMRVETADFLEHALPVGVARDFARGAFAELMAGREERSRALEERGYVVDRSPDVLSRVLEERGRNLYADHLRVFDLVLDGRIKIVRGEARGFVGEGLVIHDAVEGRDKVLRADGVVFATGYADVDLAERFAESGFVDAKSASMLENAGANITRVDAEGEIPGMVTYSGHPHLYFAGWSFHSCRWMSRYVAIQIMTGITGKFPERYPRDFV